MILASCPFSYISEDWFGSVVDPDPVRYETLAGFGSGKNHSGSEMNVSKTALKN
jgi:hypothetical protein